MPKNWQARERKLSKHKRMVVSNRSIFVMDQAAAKRNAKAQAAYEKQRRKEKGNE